MSPELLQVKIEAFFILIFALALTYLFYTLIKSTIKELNEQDNDDEILVRFVILITLFIFNLISYYAIVTRVINPEYIINN